MRREVKVFEVLFVFGVFGRELEIGKDVDVYGNLEYLGSGYEKGGHIKVFGGMGAYKENKKMYEVRGLIC